MRGNWQRLRQLLRNMCRDMFHKAGAFSLLLCASASPAVAADFAVAGSAVHMATETEIYEWDAGDDGPDAVGNDAFGNEAFANHDSAAVAQNSALAFFGPFRVVTPTRAELLGSIETGTPAQFRALLAAYPAIRQIDMVDCPGTGDDIANFEVARMIRNRGIATHVPGGGFVASGAVELFLAGTSRSAAPTAQFAVHSWRDSGGAEAGDYAGNDPVHREYIRFYREVGMDDAKAHAFYALTNSVGHDDALYLKPSDIARFVALN